MMGHLTSDYRPVLARIDKPIITLTGCGWSQRRIARELGINRKTVAKYRREARREAPSNPAILPTGSSPGRQSQCEPFAMAMFAICERVSCSQ
jgi:hypothetical protein